MIAKGRPVFTVTFRADLKPVRSAQVPGHAERLTRGKEGVLQGEGVVHLTPGFLVLVVELPLVAWWRWAVAAAEQTVVGVSRVSQDRADVPTVRISSRIQSGIPQSIEKKQVPCVPLPIVWLPLMFSCLNKLAQSRSLILCNCSC